MSANAVERLNAALEGRYRELLRGSLWRVLGLILPVLAFAGMGEFLSAQTADDAQLGWARDSSRASCTACHPWTSRATRSRWAW